MTVLSANGPEPAALIEVRCPYCRGQNVAQEYKLPVTQDIVGYDPAHEEFEYTDPAIPDYETPLDEKDAEGRFQMWCRDCLETFWLNPNSLQVEAN